MIKIAIKRLPHSIGLPLPCYQTEGSSGMDLSAAIEGDLDIKPQLRVLVPTGFAIALPAGYEAQIRPRSGLSTRHGITLINTPGTIDADYRGEVKIALINLSEENFTLQRGARIAQMVVAPSYQYAWEEVEALSETERGLAGFGSTGRGE